MYHLKTLFWSLSCFVFGSIQCVVSVKKERHETNPLNSSDGICESSRMTRTQCDPLQFNTVYILNWFGVKSCLLQLTWSSVNSPWHVFLNSARIIRELRLGVCSFFAAATWGGSGFHFFLHALVWTEAERRVFVADSIRLLSADSFIRSYISVFCTCSSCVVVFTKGILLVTCDSPKLRLEGLNDVVTCWSVC